MTITQTLRFLLKKYGAGSDPHPNREEFNLMIDAIENNGAMFSQGNTAGRPAAGKRGRFYFDEEAARMFYDNGTGWQDINPNGGGGAGRGLVIGGIGVEGTSARAARADHTHPLPLATSAAPGALAAADKAKLDAATPNATASALALRDASSRISVGTPTAPAHAATKGYVDGLITDTANYIDTSIDEISLVCTSTTRPAHVPGRKIYETDTEITRYSDGAKWHAIHMPYKQYVPQWRGFSNLGGAGYLVGGEWAIIGTNTVRASAFMVAGAGANMGMGRLVVTLPTLVADTGAVQFGDGAHIRGSVIGPQAKIIVATGNGAEAAELWVAPMTGAYGIYKTLGDSGFPWGQGDNLHIQITYKAATAVA